MSRAEWVKEQMLENIRSRRWPIGAAIPSERSLVETFGVSRLPIREALSYLEALGVLDIGHGRRPTVKKIDAGTLGQLFPLMISLEGQQSFQQIFEVRTALEGQTAYLAALRRTRDDARRLYELADKFAAEVESEDVNAVETDLEFHVQIATACKNPLMSLLLHTLTRVVQFGQIQSCKNDLVRHRRAAQSHEQIADAIFHQDAERARVEMLAHLHYSASRIVSRDQNGDLGE
ncbi:FadR family transcriptional regulator [Blastopirellula sp. J2-11]|uniref:FadR/GntR family transcriptional regulator n=1 Tax=Blastopirellula sp. J2-11 TaxID=2943192 RepID=UPI0021C57370|nr:FadR/GntR family transcriptional regulator [Blastopirellula sp. J2-11]UUO07630.1 FadR family transcriptional regulator [Blastopirellula sp. J2-11]